MSPSLPPPFSSKVISTLSASLLPLSLEASSDDSPFPISVENDVTRKTCLPSSSLWRGGKQQRSRARPSIRHASTPQLGSISATCSHSPAPGRRCSLFLSFASSFPPLPKTSSGEKGRHTRRTVVYETHTQTHSLKKQCGRYIIQQASDL